MVQIYTKALRVVGGRRQEGVPSGVAVLTPPLRPARGRGGETFLMVLDLEGVPSRLYREARAAAAQAFWTAPGGVTAALRLAAAAVNRVLFHHNLETSSQERCYGSLSCAAAREKEAFLALAGPSFACALTGAGLERFPAERLSPLGGSAYTEVRVAYLVLRPGDVLLLASRRLARSLSDDALQRILSMDELEAVADGLEQVAGGEDFVALVARWPTEATLPPPPQPSRHRRRRPAPPPPAPAREEAPAEAAPSLLPAAPVERERQAAVEEAVLPEPPLPPPPVVEEPSARTWESIPEKEPTIPTWEPSSEPVPPSQRARRLPRIQPGQWLRRVGGWIVAVGVAVGARLRALFRRALPGRERRRRRAPRERRPPPPENPRVMAGVALVILLLVAVVTLIAWLTYGSSVRRQQTLTQARQQAAQARQAADPALARGHWEAVLSLLAGMEGDPEAADLQAQAQEAIDRIDGVVRVEPLLLWELNANSSIRRLVTYGQSLFLLDEGRGRVTWLALDGGEEQDLAIPPAGEREGADLVDMAWNPADEGWSTSALVVLDAAGRLWVYDPAWPENVLSLPLGPAPGGGTPVAMATFEGRLYLLDPAAGQIWRHQPREGGYPDRAEPYFPTSAPHLLEGARDMAIDGSIYVLFQDGRIAKYLRGESVPFEPTGIPGPEPRFVALAVDPQRMDGPVYAADSAGERIVVLDSAGGFIAQLRASPDPLRDLGSLALDATGRRLFVVAGERLYALPLPFQW